MAGESAPLSKQTFDCTLYNMTRPRHHAPPRGEALSPSTRTAARTSGAGLPATGTRGRGGACVCFTLGSRALSE